MNIYDFVIRLLASIFFGLIIGIERNLTGHAVGIKTNVLVCLSSCMFVLFPTVVGSTDVVRNSAQVITGVGFLGSGIIFKDGRNVRGINTAATIWCTAGVGMITSSGKITFAAISTLLLILSNLLLKPLAEKLDPNYEFDEDGNSYQISITCDDKKEFFVRAMILNEMETSAFKLVSLESIDIAEGKVKIIAEFLCSKRRDDLAESLIAKISMEEGVFNTYWKLI